MDGITVNVGLIFGLTADYARKYGSIPETSKQAIQWAYEQGRAQAISDFAKRLHEICGMEKGDEKYPDMLYLHRTRIDEIANELKGE